jgi:hypothetical protein
MKLLRSFRSDVKQFILSNHINYKPNQLNAVTSNTRIILKCVFFDLFCKYIHVVTSFRTSVIL